MIQCTELSGSSWNEGKRHLNRTAANGCSTRHEHDAKPIHSLFTSAESASHGFCRDANDIQKH